MSKIDRYINRAIEWERVSEREIDRVRECERLREIEEKMRDRERECGELIWVEGGKKHDGKRRGVNMERERL